MRTLNIGLKKSIGMPFTFKYHLQEFLLELKTSPNVITYLSPDEVELLGKYIDNFILCTPAMGYSSKQFAYQALEIATKGILNISSPVPPEDKLLLNASMLSVLKRVGIEGETDFTFQIEVFKLAELLSRITGEVVEGTTPSVLGAISKFVVFDGGSGYFDVSGTLSDYSVELESSEDDNSVNASATVDVVSGVVTEAEYTISGGSGSGFYVGQIVLVVDDGGGSLDYDVVALAEVTEIV